MLGGRRQGSMAGTARRRSDKDYKVKNLDAVLSKISSGCTTSSSESKVMKIGGQKTDEEMEHHCFSVPRRLIVRTGLENSLSSPYNRSFQRVHSSVEMENVCQANIITKNGESIDTDKLPLLQSKEMHDCDNVDARRKLLDAYLYENDELHNCGTDIPSTLGNSLTEEFVVVHPVEPTTCICDICRKSFSTKKALIRHRKNIHRNNLAENNPWKTNRSNHKATSPDSSGNEDPATDISQSESENSAATKASKSFHQEKRKYSNSLKFEETTFLKQKGMAKNRAIVTNGSNKQLNKKSLFDSAKKVDRPSYPFSKKGKNKDVPSVKIKRHSEMNNSSDKKLKSAQESANITLQTKSVVSQSHVCKYCAMAFRNLKSLNRHIPVHTQTKYHCYKCNELFLNMRSLTKHLLLHGNDSACKNPLFSCRKCFKEFENENALHDHALSHSLCKINNTAITSVTKNDEVKVSEDTHCNPCKLFFDSHASFSKHVHDKHILLGDTSMQCDKCRKVFQSESKVFFHLIECHHVSSREARAILRQKDASAVYLGVNASINETMFSGSKKVKRLIDSDDKNSADVSKYTSSSDLSLSLEHVSLTGNLAKLADPNNDIKETESGKTDNDRVMDGAESCFLEEQESKQILEALFLEVEEDVPNPEANENIDRYHTSQTTDSTAVLNFDSYLNHDHGDEEDTSKFTKLLQEKFFIPQTGKVSKFSGKETVEDFCIGNDPDVNENIKDISPNFSALSKLSGLKTGHINSNLNEDASNTEIDYEHFPYSVRKDDCRENTYICGLTEESMVSCTKDTRAVKVDSKEIRGNFTKALVSSCIELDHLNTVKSSEQFLPGNKRQLTPGNTIRNKIPKTKLLHEIEEKARDNQNTFANAEVQNNRDTSIKKENNSGWSMSRCSNVSKEESVSGINGLGKECVDIGQPLSSLIYRRRRAAIASENKIHYSELPKKMKISEPGISITNDAPKNSKESASKQSQTSSVDLESCLKKSRVVIQDKLQNGSKAFQCNSCKNAVHKQNSSYTKDHSSKQHFLCAKISKEMGNLKRHTEKIKNETSNKRKMRKKLRDNELLCSICGKGFNSDSILGGNPTKRQNRDEADIEDSVTAVIRDQQISRKSSNVKECEVCGRTFKRYYNLMMHKKVHERRQVMQSKVCHLKYDDVELHKRHTSNRCEGKLFQCHVCHSQYKSKEKLSSHKRKCNVALKQRQKNKRLCRKSAK